MLWIRGNADPASDEQRWRGAKPPGFAREFESLPPRRRDLFGDQGAIDARRFRMLVQFGLAPSQVEDTWKAQLPGGAAPRSYDPAVRGDHQAPGSRRSCPPLVRPDRPGRPSRSRRCGPTRKPVIQVPGLQSRPSALTDGRIHPAVDERAGGVLETGRQALSYCIEPVLPVGRPREAALAVQFEQQPRGRPSPRPRPGDPAAGAQLVARARPARGPANRWPATV